jgi:hypothetical protein
MGTQALAPELAKKAALCESLRTILEYGPQVGVHTFVLSESTMIFERQSVAQFNLCVAFRLTDSESKTFVGGGEAAGLADNFALCLDKGTSPMAVKFRPYCSIEEAWLDRQLDNVKKTIRI